MTVLRRWRFWEYLPLLASVADCSWPRVSASLFSRKLSSALKKRGWRGKEEDEITAGELLWLSVHRAQWLKVNLEFCTRSDCRGVFSHQTSGCVPLQTGIKASFWICVLLSGAPASSCLAVQKLLPGMSHIVIESLYSHTKSEFNTQYKCRFFTGLVLVWEFFPQALLELTMWSIFKSGFNSICENDWFIGMYASPRGQLCIV